MVLLHLDNPQDVKTCRIIDSTRRLQKSLGLLWKTSRQDTRRFPKLLEEPFLGQCLMAFHLKEARDLGEITYGDEHVHQGTYSVRVFPLRENYLGVLIENVTDRQRADEVLRVSGERFRQLSRACRNMRSSN